MVEESTPFVGRREDARLVSGAGRYCNDWNFDGQAHAMFKRTDRAHALIASVDATAARALPGVIAVLTGADVEEGQFATLPPIPPPGKEPVRVPERPVLARDRVRFVGEPIAVVVAESARTAQDAAEAIHVSYEELPAVIGVHAAIEDGAAQLHDNIPHNVCFQFEYGDERRTSEIFCSAYGVVSLKAESPRVAPNPMEPRGFLASYDSKTDRFDVWSPNQGGQAFGRDLSVIARVPAERVSVHMLDVGGAFGARGTVFPEYCILMHLAKILRRPVKWVSSRSEDFLTDHHGRAISLAGELAYDQDGKILAIRTDWLCDSGAYLTHAGVLTNSIHGRTIAGGVYQVGNFYGRHRQVMTNTAPTNAYRGAGRPEANFIIERLIDEAAAKLRIDPTEMRRRNLIRPAQMPYRNVTGISIDSGDFPALLKEALSRADWTGFEERRRESRKQGKHRGIGCGMFVEPSGGGLPKDEVAALFQADGTIVLHNVAGPSGQGHETVFPELVAAWLGVPAERIVCRSGDPFGPVLTGNPAIGSRTAMLVGSAFKTAADTVIEKGKNLAAEMLEAPADDIEFVKGRFKVTGTDRAVTIDEVIRRHAAERPHPLDTVAVNPTSLTFPSGAHIAEVEIDAQTGAAEIVNYVAVDDIGRTINQKLAEGQLAGGIAQGIGHVFGESCHYSADGQLLTASFMDYFMPRAQGLPFFKLSSHNTPSRNNVLGAKGAGESGVTGAMCACTNATMDALRSAGARLPLDLPLTQARIWDALRQIES
jgi:carbon-monoxide dehydrogenase large subunit